MKRFLACVLLAGQAHAGVPTEERMTCPVGGEEFTTTGTASCTFFGRTMSLRPLTSCDFVTRMPVCPSNGLPVYREFTDEEVARLEQIVTAPGWDDVRMLPPFLRAYALAQELDGGSDEERFGLMLNAFWYETEALIGDPVAVQALVSEIEAELDRAPAQSAGFLHGMAAMALAHAGMTEAAREHVTRAEAAAQGENLAYVAAVAACVETPGAEGCGLDDPQE